MGRMVGDTLKLNTVRQIQTPTGSGTSRVSSGRRTVPVLISVREAARRLDVNKQRVRQFLREGVLRRHPLAVPGKSISARAVRQLNEELNGHFYDRRDTQSWDDWAESS